MVIPLLNSQVFIHVKKVQDDKPVYCVEHKPAGGCAKHVLLLVLLCLCTVSAHADQLSSLTWNCWTGSLDMAEIDCIHERGQPPLKGAPEDTDIELETQVLGQIRKKTHSGEAAKVEGLDWKNIKVLHKGAQWTIKVHFQPSGALWDENQLARLVTAVLCPGNIPCAVVTHKPAPQDILRVE